MKYEVWLMLPKLKRGDSVKRGCEGGVGRVITLVPDVNVVMGAGVTTTARSTVPAPGPAAPELSAGW